MGNVETLTRVCAWCDREKLADHRAVGHVLTAEEQRGMTHGICLDCYHKLMAEWRRRCSTC